MALFGNFDFGKSLRKQAEAYSRSPTGNRARKLPQLLKQLDEYASKLLATVIAQSSHVNPGQLRTGAEALVEVSALLQDGSAAYRVFAELAARSRKVPAVPQLGQLVDRLLELPTDQKKERSALLTYRIVTGTLGSERYLNYLRERAHLTEQTADWKEYALGVARLIRDGMVPANDELVNHALQDLVNNKHHLGDQSVPIQQMLAESMIQRRNHRQAEFVLVEAAISNKELPDSFYETVEALLDAKPETCWELHQLIIERSLGQLESGATDWPEVLQRLAGAKLHEQNLLSFLIEHPLTSLEARLVAYVRQNIPNLDSSEQAEMLGRFDQMLSSGGLQTRAEATVAPKPPRLGGAAGETQHREYLEAAARGVVDDASLRKLLEQNVEVQNLDLPGLRAFLRQLAGAGLPDWAPLEARIWLVEQLTAQSRERIAIQLLDDLLLQVGARETQLISDRLRADVMRRLLERLRKAHGERSIAEVWLRMVRLCIVGGEFREAKRALAEIPADAPQSRQAFAELEHWITRQAEPTPWMLMTLSEARRDLADDPQAGLDVATQAALLAPDDKQVQDAYQQWSATVPTAIVLERRLTQSVYLLTREDRLELLPGLLQELERAQENQLETLEWISQLLPIYESLRGVTRSKTREALLRLLANASPEGLAESLDQLMGDLDDEEQSALLKRLLSNPGRSESVLAARAAKVEEKIATRARTAVESEIGLARHNGRPIRYSAGELIPPANPLAAPSKSAPWRRSLAIARRKRGSGDFSGALRDLQIALELAPREVELNLELAQIHVARREYPTARELFKSVLEAATDAERSDIQAPAVYGLAIVAEQLENLPEAMRYFEELVEIDPEFQDSRDRMQALKRKLTQESELAGASPSNIAANVILDAILDLLNSRALRAGAAS